MTYKFSKSCDLTSDVGASDCGAVYRTKCLNCQTVFEWDTGEAKLQPDPRDGDYYVIPCPVCGRDCTKQKPALRWTA